MKPIPPAQLDVRLQNPTGMRCQLLRDGMVIQHGWIRRWHEGGITLSVKSSGAVKPDLEYDLQAYGHFQKIKTKVKVLVVGAAESLPDSIYASSDLHLEVVGAVAWKEGTEAIRLFLPGHPITLRQSNHLIQGTSLDAGPHGMAVMLPSAVTVGAPAILRISSPKLSATASVIIRSCIRQAKGVYRVGGEVKNGSQIETASWADFLETALGRSIHAA